MECEINRDPDCCFICRHFNIEGVYDTAIKNGDLEKWDPCEYYPEKLPRTPDILEVYICGEFERIELKTIPQDKKRRKIFGIFIL